MEKHENIFKNELSIEALEKRFEMSQAGLIGFLSVTSCIPITPTIPPNTGG